MSRDNRPVFLNLFQIRLPFPGLASISHRVSGVLLFLVLPLVLWLLMKAKESPEAFNQVVAIINSPHFLLVVLVVSWAFWHHLLAGIRFLFLDLEIGLDKTVSQRSAQLVIGLGVLAAVLSTLAWCCL